MATISCCIGEAHRFEELYRTPGAHALSVVPTDADDAEEQESAEEEEDDSSSDDEA